MTATDPAPYRILEIQPDWVLESEAMGSKDKFWYRDGDGPDWLFKFPQPNTGQHWSEKIAAEVADGLDILHAQVELAVFQGVRGSATESFTREGREVYFGNQVLAGHVLGYDPGKQFRQSDHTLENIVLALERVFLAPKAARRAKEQLADYLVLDALIGNTDRHHENWGILRKRTEREWQVMLAPTFDHASPWVANWWMTALASAAAGCWQKADWRSMRRRRPARFSGKRPTRMEPARLNWYAALPACIPN